MPSVLNQPLARKAGPIVPARTPKPGLLRRQGCVLEFSLDGAALLFHPEMKLLCQLNETAYFVWRHCEGCRAEDVVTMLTDAFQVGIETARQHVAGVIELFSISGFLAEETVHAVAC